MSSKVAIYKKILGELQKVIVGQDEVLEKLVIAVLAGGHAIIEGVPGLAKTLIINSLARALDLSFNRIQFTPDMMPSDITGTEIVSPGAKGEREFRFVPGPVFANLILADEINRTPPKTQSALLQAMQEYQVTTLGKTYPLPEPFFVLATQNPIEYEGTYPLPEAQLDRFLFYIGIQYPEPEQEMAIVDADPSKVAQIRPVVTSAELKKLMAAVRDMPVADKVKEYAVNLVRCTRPGVSPLDSVKKYVEWGAGPRATQMLVRAARARAFLFEKKLTDKQDIDAVFEPCLLHRVILNYNAAADGITVSRVLGEIKKQVEAGL